MNALGALLIALVAATSAIPRTSDPQLNALALTRAQEQAAGHQHHRYLTELSTSGDYSRWAEVLGHSNRPDPTSIVSATDKPSWRSSPSHWAAISDPRYTRIGCAEIDESGASYYVCILATPTQPASRPKATAPPSFQLPNTSIQQ